MSSQRSLMNTSSKLKEVKRRIRKSYLENNSCLRVIAEKIVTWRYFELADEFRALRLTISTLKEENVEWSKSQIRRAIKKCYDPRYYYREAIEEIYELAKIDIDYLPSVPKDWGGITEWKYPENDVKSD